MNVALATLLVTGGKLIFVDLVAVDVLWRAALFFLIGGTYLRLGFILPKLRQEPESATTPEGSTRTARAEEPSRLGSGS